MLALEYLQIFCKEKLNILKTLVFIFSILFSTEGWIYLFWSGYNSLDSCQSEVLL